jgi:hypothetical protein
MRDIAATNNMEPWDHVVEATSRHPLDRLVWIKLVTQVLPPLGGRARLRGRISLIEGVE